MSVTRPNPIHQAVVGLISGKGIDEQVADLHEQLKEDDAARQDWLHKQEKLLRQRRGVRRSKVYPWPGANNHSWPLTDAIIRRWKPGMTALITQAEPVAYFLPLNMRAVQVAPTAQEYYHWRFHTLDNMKRTAMELLDYVAQYGHGYTRQGWSYRTDRQCRIVPVNSLFPGGADAAHQAYLNQAAALRAQAEQAVQAGQAPPEALEQLPPQLDRDTFIRQVLEDEYVIKDDNPLEAGQVDAAVKAIVGGAEVVKFYYRVVVADKASWRAVSPLDVIIPPRTENVAEADRIAVVHRFSVDTLIKMAMDGHFDLNRAQQIAEKMRSRSVGDPERGWLDPLDSTHSAIQDVMDRADGISTGHVEEPTVSAFLEVYCLLDLDGDGILEKCILWYHPETKITLALYAYPYPFKEWAIVKHDFEHLDNRPLGARGISELVAVFQAHVNKFHNARLDALQITLSPMFQVRSSSGEQQRNIKFMPGTLVPVSQVGDIAPLPVDTRGIIASLNEENLTKGLAEQYVGIFDPSVMAQQSVERRTATEVEAVIQQTQAIFGQDAELLQDSMAQVHRQLWMLIQEFGPEEEYFRVTGEDKPRLAKKHELAQDYDIVPAGTPGNTSKALATARAREALQLFGQDTSGLIRREELYSWYFSSIDPKLAKRLVRPPDQAALVQQMMQIVAQNNEENGVPPSAMPLPP